MNKPFSQAEAKLVADWLRQHKKLEIKNSLLFWRKSPVKAVEWIRAGWPNITITAQELVRAAGRDDQRSIG